MANEERRKKTKFINKNIYLDILRVSCITYLK